mmetsp:Transcript_121936/g.304282  ORF Transcript_121936/g.304282 Transcript_121936/m.304282 type:complete len:104 (+) Transcript_121936:133-444(+)
MPSLRCRLSWLCKAFQIVAIDTFSSAGVQEVVDGHETNCLAHMSLVHPCWDVHAHLGFMRASVALANQCLHSRGHHCGQWLELVFPPLGSHDHGTEGAVCFAL